MAKYNKGYLGSFNGKLGTAVGFTGKGIPVLRSLGTRSGKGKPSVTQQS